MSDGVPTLQTLSRRYGGSIQCRQPWDLCDRGLRAVGFRNHGVVSLSCLLPLMDNCVQNSFPVRLVCPACRIPGEDGCLIVSHLEPETPFGDRCGQCGTLYPRIEGVRCVPPDLKSFRDSQASSLVSQWVCNEAQGAINACGRAGEVSLPEVEFAEILFLGQHALAHFPNSAALQYEELECNLEFFRTMRRWMEQNEAPKDSPLSCALEIGCGPGAFVQAVAPLFSTGALGLDLRISLLLLARRMADCGGAFIAFCSEGRRFEPIRISVPSDLAAEPGQVHFVQGDIAAPPLDAESFPAVIALSLLDSVSDPFFALGQLDALLAPRGLLLVGTPYSWDPRTTGRAEWWSHPGATGGETLRATLGGKNPVLPYLRYEVLAQADRMCWAIPGHSRLVYRFFLDVVLARKCG